MSFLREVRLEDEFGPFVVFQGDLGFIRNLFRAQSRLPRVIEAQASLENAVRLEEGGISRVQKGRILLSVAAARHDTCCVTLESNALVSLGASDNQIVSQRHCQLRTFGFTDQISEGEAVNNFANILQMGLGIEPEFEPPSSFLQNRAHFSKAIRPSMPTGSVVRPSGTAIEGPDGGWAAKARAGDLDASEVLVRRHGQMIYRASMAILGNRSDLSTFPRGSESHFAGKLCAMIDGVRR